MHASVGGGVAVQALSATSGTSSASAWRCGRSRTGDGLLLIQLRVKIQLEGVNILWLK